MAPGGERRGGPESKDGFEGRDLLVGPKGYSPVVTISWTAASRSGE